MECYITLQEHFCGFALIHKYSCDNVFTIWSYIAVYFCFQNS